MSNNLNHANNLNQAEARDFDNFPLFADVPGDFDPEVAWLDGESPAHPFFNDHSSIQSIIRNIKEIILQNALLGCKTILCTLAQEPAQNVTVFRRSLGEKPDLWKAVISTQKYGVIYWASRSDARRHFWPLIQENTTLAEEIDAYLRKDGLAVRAINYGVYRFVTKAELTVETPVRFVPPNAIACIGERHIAVRKVDFDKPIEEILSNRKPLFDLHDFAHLTVATMSSELYGNKYQTDLVKLNPSLTALIRSPGIKTGKGPKISDGILFSELLTGIFTHEIEAAVKKEKKHTYRSLVEIMARRLADYLLGRCALQHPSTQEMIRAPTPITPTQLAVLAQNKAYELPASEIEQRLFTRGGSDNDEKDLLENMTARQRIETMAKSKRWMYFEVRNTTKHRAHKDAYKMVALYYLEEGVEAELCKMILENITYEDWRKGERRNLWNLVV